MEIMEKAKGADKMSWKTFGKYEAMNVIHIIVTISLNVGALILVLWAFGHFVLGR